MRFMDNKFENPKPKKGETEKKFINRCIPYVHKEHPSWEHDKVVAVCYSYWRDRNKTNEEMFTNDAVFVTVPIKEQISEENTETMQTGTKNMIAIIGNRFMNGGFLSAEVLEKSYKQWEGTLHDINHMGTSTGFFLAQSDITYFIGYHTNVKYNKETKEVSMELNVEPDCKFTEAWTAYVKLCERAGKIPNVSVTYYGKRDFKRASDLPNEIPWKQEGYKEDDLVPILNSITPICVSTVLQGRCNDKDGCGLRNDECDLKLEEEIEKKKQEIIERIKNKQLELEN